MIKIVSQGGAAAGSKIIDSETGKDLGLDVMGMDISLADSDSLVIATARLAMVELEVEAAIMRFMLRDPQSHEWKQIDHIQFADGTGLDFRGDGAPVRLAKAEYLGGSTTLKAHP